jgi:hypothetical protein
MELVPDLAEERTIEPHFADRIQCIENEFDDRMRIEIGREIQLAHDSTPGPIRATDPQLRRFTVTLIGINEQTVPNKVEMDASRDLGLEAVLWEIYRRHHTSAASNNPPAFLQ